MTRDKLKIDEAKAVNALPIHQLVRQLVRAPWQITRILAQLITRIPFKNDVASKCLIRLLAVFCSLHLISTQAQEGYAPMAASNNLYKDHNSYGLNEPWKKGDVAVFFAMGQSNSVSRSFLSIGSDQVNVPLANVHIARANKNMNYKNATMNWEAFSTNVKGNVMGKDSSLNRDETQSDKLANSPAYIARQWQNAKDNGHSLPDLYIVHVAIGGQGISCALKTNNDWCIDKDQNAVSSLYWLSRALIQRTLTSLRAAGHRPRIVGVDWDQWESDADSSVAAKDYGQNIKGLINGLSAAAGVPLPVWLHQPNQNKSGAHNTAAISSHIHQLIQSDPKRYKLIDPVTQGGMKQSGLFNADGIHYKEAVQKWMALKIWDEIAKKNHHGVIPSEINTVTYGFDHDAEGDTSPSGLKINSGSFKVGGRIGQSGHALIATSGALPTATFNWFPSNDGYYVSWRHVHATSANFRAGMVLRAQANHFYDRAADLMAGYLFQVNRVKGVMDVRIYRLDPQPNNQPSSRTAKLLQSKVISSTTVHEVRWYKASVSGHSLNFYYSESSQHGPWTPAASATDATYGMGLTQYADGFGDDELGVASIDDVKYQTSP
jgi:hypothetical protein